MRREPVWRRWLLGAGLCGQAVPEGEMNRGRQKRAPRCPHPAGYCSLGAVKVVSSSEVHLIWAFQQSTCGQERVPITRFIWRSCLQSPSWGSLVESSGGSHVKVSQLAQVWLSLFTLKVSANWLCFYFNTTPSHRCGTDWNKVC